MKIKKLAALTFSLILLTGCSSRISSQDGGTEIIEYSTSSTTSDSLLERITYQLDEGYPDKAARIYEENIDSIPTDEKYTYVLDEMISEFTDIAREYYKSSEEYTESCEVSGYDCNTGFEGYDPADRSLDPQVLDISLTSRQRAVLDRVKIECISDEKGSAYDFRVTVELCGTSAVYPPDETAAAPAVKYDDSERLLYDIEKHIRRSEFFTAAALFEENSRLCASDERLSEIPDRLTDLLTETAESIFLSANNYYIKQCTIGTEPEAGEIHLDSTSMPLTQIEKNALPHTVVMLSYDPDADIAVSVNFCGTSAVWPPADTSIQTDKYDDPEKLIADLKSHIARKEYLSAALLYEANIDLCASDSRFVPTENTLREEFEKTAKNFYINACTHITREQVMVGPSPADYERYDTDNNTLDPHVLEYLMTDPEKSLADRTVIYCDKDGNPERVTIDICGKTIEYPME